MSGTPTIRAVRRVDAAAWARMRTSLWPEWPEDHPREIAEYLASPPTRWTCLVAEDEGGLVGFAEVRLRDCAEGCSTSPVGYLEGIWVDPIQREAGVGRALVDAASDWSRTRGCTEMASDRALDNEPSGAFHVALGFEEVGRAVCYRRAL